MEYLIALIESLIGQAVLVFKITFLKEVTGDYLIFNGVSISKWQRCRVLKNAKIVCFNKPAHMITVDNRLFHFTLDNVSICLMQHKGEL